MTMLRLTQHPALVAAAYVLVAVAVLAPASVSAQDTDGDGISDADETNGVTINGIFLDLPGMGADPMHADIFLELDWTTPRSGCTAAGNVGSNGPSRIGFDEMVRAFAAAPYPNPDGTTGINIHVDTGKLRDGNLSEKFPDGTDVGPGSCCRDFDGDGNDDDDGDGLPDDEDPDCLLNNDLAGFPLALRRGNEFAEPSGLCAVCGGMSGQRDPVHWIALQENFDDVRHEYFRHGIYALGSGCGSGGQADGIPGHTFLSLNRDFGTVMHELGHTLGLRHGGSDNWNCKPNYQSVMQYNLQFGILRTPGSPGGIQIGGQPAIYDFSPPRYDDGTNARGVALRQLDQCNLDESLGMAVGGGAAADPYNMIVWEAPGGEMRRAANLAQYDWDGDGTIENDVEVDYDTGACSGLENVGDLACSNGGQGVSQPFDDWALLATGIPPLSDDNYAPEGIDGCVRNDPDPPTRTDEELEQDLLQMRVNLHLVTISVDPIPMCAGGASMISVTVEHMLLPVPSAFFSAMDAVVTLVLQDSSVCESVIPAAGCTTSDGVTITCIDVPMVPGLVLDVDVATCTPFANAAYPSGTAQLPIQATVSRPSAADTDPSDNTFSSTFIVVPKTDVVAVLATITAPSYMLIDTADTASATGFAYSAGPANPVDVTCEATWSFVGGTVGPATMLHTEDQVLTTTPQGCTTPTTSITCNQRGITTLQVSYDYEIKDNVNMDTDLSNNMVSQATTVNCIEVVDINIKPGYNPNSIWLAGDVSVAVLADASKTFFTGNIIDSSVRFGRRDDLLGNTGNRAPAMGPGTPGESWIPDDTAKTGATDRTYKFSVPATDIDDNTVEACVIGRARDPLNGNLEYTFFGCDVVEIDDCPITPTSECRFFFEGFPNTVPEFMLGAISGDHPALSPKLREASQLGVPLPSTGVSGANSNVPWEVLNNCLIPGVPGYPQGQGWDTHHFYVNWHADGIRAMRKSFNDVHPQNSPSLKQKLAHAAMQGRCIKINIDFYRDQNNVNYNSNQRTDDWCVVFRTQMDMSVDEIRALV